MKRFYLTICSVFLFSLVFGQVKDMQSFNNIQDLKNVGYIASPSFSNPHSMAPAPFWTNDFSDPNEWTMTDIIYGGLQNWVITTQGPQGSFSNAMGVIASTTASNGFALFDSDYLNTAYNPQEATLTYNGYIDCSGYQNVNINFECYHRVFHDSVFVETSGDPSFLNITGRYKIHEGLAVNSSSPNPDFVSVNISASAGNQSMVYFRFHYEGEWDYAIMIDDVSFSETPDNLITFADETFGGWWIGYQSTGDLGSDYTFYPMSQAIIQPYRFEGVISNDGIQIQNNVILNVEVEDPFNSTVMYTSNGITLNSGERDTVATSTNFAPTTMGIHRFGYWASSQNTITDTIFRSTIVTDTIYGVDFDWNSDGTNAGGGYYLGRSCGGQVLGNVFDIYADDTLTSISFHVNDKSVVNSELKVELYEMDGTNDPILLDESNPYNLTSTDIDSWVTISFNAGNRLYAGTAYLAAVHGTQHPVDTSLISSNANPNSSSWLQDNGCDIGSTPQPIGTWYTVGNALLIRMNFGGSTSPPPIPTWDCVSPGNCVDPGNGMGQYPSLGACQFACGSTDINENIQDYLIYPNPSNGIITIDFADNRKHIVTIENLVGQIVYSDEYSSLSTGNINLSGYEKGIYLITISDDINSNTQKMIIE